MFAFTLAFSLTILFDIAVAFVCLHQRQGGGRLLGLVMLSCALTNFGYMMGSRCQNYFHASIYFAVHFSSVDIMLLFLLAYTARLTEQNTLMRPLRIGVYVYAALDVLCELLNPFTGFALTFRRMPAPGLAFKWVYVAGVPYGLHLIFSYLLVAFIIFLVVRKIRSVPAVYRQRYAVLGGGLLAIVLLNAVFLFLPDNLMFDYSILLYGLFGTIFYVNEYYYMDTAMLNVSRHMMFDETRYPVLLFDYEKLLASCNTASHMLFGEKLPGHEYTLNRFIEENGLSDQIKQLEKDHSLQISPVLNGEQKVCSCGIHVQHDKKGRILGWLVTIRDRSLEIDAMTGFDTEMLLFRKFDAMPVERKFPASIGIVDINALVTINQEYGRSAGDLAIQKVASEMRRLFPEGSIFVRLRDANLLVFSPWMKPEAMADRMRELQDAIAHQDTLEFSFGVQFSVTPLISKGSTLQGAIDRGSRTLINKKLMDEHSTHASLLDSLAQVQTESDVETEAHVVRTRDMGQKLGRRIGLSDSDMVRLALLCLLHDIGKVGIPLDILTKPYGLTNHEWQVIKSHVEKGYRIVKASPELEDIAELVLYHHESWDGSGYPDGLKHETIPLLSRIIAVVDSYDAMTNDRPYRKALSKQKARAELQRCSGKMYDPNIVSEFLALLDEIDPVTGDAGAESDSSYVKTIPMSLREVNGEERDAANMREVCYSKYVINAENRILTIDDSFTKMTGYTEQDVKALALRQIDLLPPEDQPGYMALTMQILSANSDAYIEHRLRCKDGGIKHVFCYGRMYFDSALREMRSEIVITDIADMDSVRTMLLRQRQSSQRGMERFEQAARKDSMTGVLNHDAYQNECQQHLTETDGPSVLAMLDVDHFKDYNDTYGHPAGDELLKTLAMTMQEAIGNDGIVGRMGGDEFSVLLRWKKGTPSSEIVSYFDRLWGRMEGCLSGCKGSPTISLGAVISEPGQADFQRMYKACDTALYNAKEAGRSRYVFADSSLLKQA